MTVATAERSAVDIRDIIKPLPRQERLLDEMYRREFLLFGGAAGGGKSHALRWAGIELLLWWASQGFDRVRLGLFCESYPALRDRQITKIQREFPSWLGELRGSQAEGYGFYLRPQWGGGAMMLRNLDDPQKYLSAEFAAILIDQAERVPRQTFDDLRHRKRWPGIDHSPFIITANPGGIGHAWIKKLWIDRDFSGDDARLDPEAFLFIPSTARDNPYLPDSYWRELDALPDALRRAMLEGDWSIFAGQVFAEWRHHLHVVEPFAVPATWTRWVGVDYGYARPFCALWLARSPDGCRLLFYRELYKEGIAAADQAKAIRLASQGENISLYAADPSMWQRRERSAGGTLAGEYEGAGIRLTRANNDRMAGLAAWRAALAWKEIDGYLVQPPRLQVFSSCTNLIRTLPVLPYDQIRVEDVDTRSEDDCYDAGRYALMVEQGRQWKGPTRPVRLYDI